MPPQKKAKIASKLLISLKATLRKWRGLSNSGGLDVEDRVTLRMVKGMAVWACAGRIAINTKLLNLKPDQVIEALRFVLREHLARQSHKMTPIGEQIINHVRDLIDRNSGRFQPLSMFRSAEQNGIFGYTKVVAGVRLYLFLTGAFEKHAACGFGTALVTQSLKDAGYLESNSAGSQYQVRVPSTDNEKGLRKRFYAVKESIRFDT